MQGRQYAPGQGIAAQARTYSISAGAATRVCLMQGAVCYILKRSRLMSLRPQIMQCTGTLVCVEAMAPAPCGPLSCSVFSFALCSPPVDYKGELRRLSGELLFMFLELIKTVVEQPSRWDM